MHPLKDQRVGVKYGRGVKYGVTPVLGLAKGSALRLVGSGLKFCKEDMNMAAINFSPLQILKWL